ncbi:uroporphyrinogen decarboxylase [Ramaria rubella]|nr:uroporphyrinogen decarboxylase [Ramaria rubella]
MPSVGEVTERAPVWVMRQAGRYLPEFRKVRESNEFFEVCRTPALATEVTMQPIRRYSGLLDASIIFSDILVIPQAMGLVVEMNPAPSFPEPLSVPADMHRLKEDVDVNTELGYVYEAVTQTRHALNGEVPLIGFVGAPWTLMAYMIEGGGSKTLEKAKTWLFKYPEESKALLSRIADVCADHLVGQIKAGAQAVQVFDSWAGELTPYNFATFSLPSLVHISTRVRTTLAELSIPAVPMILFAKGANTSLTAQVKHAGYDVIGLDWVIDPSEARRIVDATATRPIALQGNFDPAILFGGREAIEREVKRICESFKGGAAPKAWIANLGHGITPGVDPEDMRWFLECVQKYSAKAP